MGFQIFDKHATIHITIDVTVHRSYTEYVTGDTSCSKRNKREDQERNHEQKAVTAQSGPRK